LLAPQVVVVEVVLSVSGFDVGTADTAAVAVQVPPSGASQTAYVPPVTLLIVEVLPPLLRAAGRVYGIGYGHWSRCHCYCHMMLAEAEVLRDGLLDTATDAAAG
jgi:hypothetical protein